MSGTIEIAGQLAGRAKEATSIAKPKLIPLNFTRRIAELDGYRGMAVALALFFHYIRLPITVRPPHVLGYLFTATPLTWSGMEMFFVLSGFLIGGILLDARTSANYFSTFYVRRFCRIVPAYYLLLGLVAIAYHFLYGAVGAPLDWTFGKMLPWYSYLTFMQNAWMSNRETPGAIILGVTWSIAVEEQFYLLLPLVIRYVRKSAIPYICAAGFLSAPIIRLIIVYRFRAHLWSTYVLLPCRMDSLFFGVLCAYCVREPKIWNWLVTHRTAVFKVLLVLIAGMPLLNNQGIPLTLLWVSVGIGWMSIFYGSLILLALTGPTSTLSHVMRWKWFASLGEIGYSVYLFHLGIYCMCMWMFTNHGWQMESWKDFGVTLIALAVTILFCKLSWVYFERPIVRWGHKWSYKSAIALNSGTQVAAATSITGRNSPEVPFASLK